jgi:uncharacterized membrane protein
MSLVALMVGLPLPIVNLIATTIFYFNNKRSAYFVRWHCMQALLMQAIAVGMNAAGIYWTLSIIFGNHTLTNNYIAYIFTIMLFNLAEFIATIYAAVQTRKGRHIDWWFFGPLTNTLVKK